MGTSSNYVVGAAALCAFWLGPSIAVAAETPPNLPSIDKAVDVAIKDAPPRRRRFALELNPIALVIERLSANVEIVPVDHHALVVSPFYFGTTTTAWLQSTTDSAGNPLTVDHLAQSFTGWGAELGYRYYTLSGGPRGFYVGPSLLFSSIRARAGDGTSTRFASLGLALDAGYQVLVADDWVVGLGAGIQYTAPSQSIPEQQLPASLYVNAGVRPRLLLALGYSF